ncbi:hypothetical protein FOXG_19000 [Fusarium oxysporum f. sp. lycopersici 4287]|uniref:Uncharacterized protein n=2 Tax=Fusarium oxysporum TaxID=5507 RepID=A0A0J9UUW6_FUSO4|nr:hypothetical protein FOXG_19000 [Fusarium oxysporum f. sp. lycopersici 4287]EXK39150.1 hypothetical protein FOMG_06566 [Fusarium oxysporum f. sp. melonis 26406]KAJ9421815.1 hypothetical protein QL093DRAFT_2098848 [Fusarium oxysporum]KNB02216.1 hypothetical protein FOXG_19000 [Fusarium oxysporum f. sp. lycopersici 4287]
MEQIKSGVTEQRPERCANTPVYFGLTLNYEAGSIFGSGKTKAIRAEAIYNYDAAEIRRVRDYNRDNVRANARRAIKKWSQEGSHKRNDEDSFYWN